MRWINSSSGLFRWISSALFLIDHFILLTAAFQAALGPRKEPAGLLPGSDDRPADVLLPFLANGKDAALDVSVVNPLQQPTCWKLSGKKKRESNMPSISKWGNTVIDARRRESCSLGGYESPWAPGGAIFIPGEIMTRREYWKPFFSQLNQF